MRSDKICVVTTEKHLLVQEIEKHAAKAGVGVGVDVIRLKQLKALVLGGVLTSNLTEYRAVYLDRAEESWMNYGFQFLFLDFLFKSGAKIINKPMAYMRAHDKVSTTLELIRHGLPVVDTIICYDVETAMANIKRWPVAIAKPPLGYDGIGITVFETDNPPEHILTEQLKNQGFYTCRSISGLPVPETFEFKWSMAMQSRYMSASRSPKTNTPYVTFLKGPS